MGSSVSTPRAHFVITIITEYPQRPSRTGLNNRTLTYKEASEAAGALATELGEDHSLSQEIRKIRRGMSNEAARGPHKPSTP